MGGVLGGRMEGLVGVRGDLNYVHKHPQFVQSALLTRLGGVFGLNYLRYLNCFGCSREISTTQEGGVGRPERARRGLGGRGRIELIELFDGRIGPIELIKLIERIPPLTNSVGPISLVQLGPSRWVRLTGLFELIGGVCPNNQFN